MVGYVSVTNAGKVSPRAFLLERKNGNTVSLNIELRLKKEDQFLYLLLPFIHTFITSSE
jgi:hypothetical protein